jgi:hypothetical protein
MVHLDAFRGTSHDPFQRLKTHSITYTVQVGPSKATMSPRPRPSACLLKWYVDDIELECIPTNYVVIRV